jgi:hypothetical protein
MQAELKNLADGKDVLYQSLAKVYLARQIALEGGSSSRSIRKKRELSALRSKARHHMHHAHHAIRIDGLILAWGHHPTFK